MRTMAVLVVFGVVLASGCHRNPGAIMTPQREKVLRQLASKDLSCPAENLELQFVGSIDQDYHLYRMNGCEGQYEAILDCGIASHPRGHCVWASTPDKQAATELQCPASELKRNYSGSRTFEIAGCGQPPRRYVNVDGVWVVLSSTPASEPAPAQ